MDKLSKVGAVMALIIDSELAEGELLQVNREVCSMINSVRRGRLAAAAATFRVGDKVWFASRKRGRKEGKVTKISRTTIGVEVERPGYPLPENWRVAASLLHKVA